MSAPPTAIPVTETSLSIVLAGLNRIAAQDGTWSIDECVLLDESTGAKLPLATPVVPPCTINVRGWATDPHGDGLAAGIVAFLDDRVVEVTYGQTREDVAQSKRDPRVVRCGYTARVRVSDPEHRRYQIQVFSVDAQVREAARLGDPVAFETGGGTLVQAVDTAAGTGFGALQVDGWTIDGEAERSPSEPAAVERGGLLTLRGWAYDAASMNVPRAVYGIVDGTAIVRALTGLERSDVAASFGSAALAASGFVLRVDTATLAVGRHIVQPVVLDASGSRYEVVPAVFGFDVVPWREMPVYAVGEQVRSRVVRGARPWGITQQLREATPGLATHVATPHRPGVAVVRLDTWRIDDRAETLATQPLHVPNGAIVTISGWAADQSALSAPSAVYASVDGGPALAATARLPRYDVSAALKVPTYDAAGFIFRLDTLTHAVGSHVLRFLIVTADGQAYDIAETILPFEIVHSA